MLLIQQKVKINLVEVLFDRNFLDNIFFEGEGGVGTVSSISACNQAVHCVLIKP